MHLIRHVFKARRRRRHERYVVWGVAAAIATVLLALLAALVWLQRPAPGTMDLLGLPRLSAWTPAPEGLAQA